MRLKGQNSDQVHGKRISYLDFRPIVLFTKLHPYDRKLCDMESCEIVLYQIQRSILT